VERLGGGSEASTCAREEPLARGAHGTTRLRAGSRRMRELSASIAPSHAGLGSSVVERRRPGLELRPRERARRAVSVIPSRAGRLFDSVAVAAGAAPRSSRGAASGARQSGSCAGEPRAPRPGCASVLRARRRGAPPRLSATFASPAALVIRVAPRARKPECRERRVRPRRRVSFAFHVFPAHARERGDRPAAGEDLPPPRPRTVDKPGRDSRRPRARTGVSGAFGRHRRYSGARSDRGADPRGCIFSAPNVLQLVARDARAARGRTRGPGAARESCSARHVPPRWPPPLNGRELAALDDRSAHRARPTRSAGSRGTSCTASTARCARIGVGGFRGAPGKGRRGRGRLLDRPRVATASASRPRPCARSSRGRSRIRRSRA
jgi:hypothetical protein